MGRRGCGWRKRTSVTAWALLCLGSAMPSLTAQSCTTQAKMSPELRDSMSQGALSLATAVKAGDAAKVQTLTVAEFATPAEFASTAALVRSTADKLAADSLQLTQLYALNAQGRKPGDTTDADFSCALSGSTAETDFSISGLPPGMYGFAMVEAVGERPWLLAFLLRQDGGVWKMAGFYPRARTAAGHDGGWYWNEAYRIANGKPANAREVSGKDASGNAAQTPVQAQGQGEVKDLWLAWLLFGEADLLLRPANFATSTKLDSLRSQQRNATPPELVDGISPTTPLVLKAKDGAEYRYTDVHAEGSEDGKQLNLILHLRAEPGVTGDAARARNKGAAKTFVEAHAALRGSFQRVLVFGDTPGQPPFLTETTMADI